MTTTPTPVAPNPVGATSGKFGGLAWSAVILGIVGVVGSPIIIFNNLTAVAAGVGVILGVIALFGGRKVLAGIGVALSVLAIVFTVIVQGNAVAELDRELGAFTAGPADAPAPTDRDPLAPVPWEPVAPAPPPAAPDPAPAGPAAEFGPGTHVVGVDIQPGTYRTAGPTSSSFPTCYWARLTDTSGEFDSIITNNMPTGPATVTIAESDGAFETSGCAQWTKVG